MIIDVNTFYGHWPFRKIEKESMSDIENNAKENNIDSMIISSIDSIFYQDPFEGDEDLAPLIPDGSYQALTINPTQGFFEDDINEGIEKFGIKAVRIHPEYHNFLLTDKCVARLFDVLYEHKLPLIITSIMEDARMMHFRSQSQFTYDQLASAIQHNKKIPVVVTNYSQGNWRNLAGIVQEYGNLYFDTSGIKFGLLDIIDTVIKNSQVPDTNIVYGSHYPLYCRKSTLSYFEIDEMDNERKDRILFKNAKQIFNL